MEPSASMNDVDAPNSSWRTFVFKWLLDDWQPRLTTHALLCVLLASAILCLGLGIPAIIASSNVIELQARYDDQCVGQTSCTIELTATDDMQAPLYFYYRLTQYNQNSRRYVKSRSDSQIQGDELLTSDETSDCEPRLEASDSSLTQYPCGLVAFTWFNDEFNMTVDDGPTLSSDNWDASAIAWPSDVASKFVFRDLASSESSKIERDGDEITLPLLNDQNLMVWMRPAALPNFMKLYRIVNSNSISKGQKLSVSIDNKFTNPIGEKYIVLSTVSWLGGKNTFLGILFLVCAILLTLTAIAIIFIERFVPSTRRKTVL